MWTVFVEGLEFYGFHGVPEAERHIGHRYRATVRVEIRPLRNPAADDVAQTLDYSHLAETVLDVNQSQAFQTVEAFAWEIAREIFNRFKSAESVEIELAKPAPPMPVIAEMAGVWLQASREDVFPQRR